MRSRKAQSSGGSTPSRGTLEELQQRNDELRAAVAARDAFIAVAAHELRNPMTPMIGQIDLLLRGLRAGRYNLEQIEQRLERVRLVMNHISSAPRPCLMCPGLPPANSYWHRHPS